MINWEHTSSHEINGKQEKKENILGLFSLERERERGKEFGADSNQFKENTWKN